MSAGDAFGLAISLLILVYLVYALFRGENLLVGGQGIAQIVVYAVVLIALAYPLGMYMARVFGSLTAPRFLSAIERGFYRLVRTDPTREQDWKSYGKTVLVFSLLFSVSLYAILRLQGHLFLNPDHLTASSRTSR